MVTTDSDNIEVIRKVCTKKDHRKTENLKKTHTIVQYTIKKENRRIRKQLQEGLARRAKP